MLFLGGISLDLWRVFSERRALASIADAAAIAGTSGIDEGVFRSQGEVVLNTDRNDPEGAYQRALASIRSNRSDFRNLENGALADDPDIEFIRDEDDNLTRIQVTLRGRVEVSLLKILATVGGGNDGSLEDPFEVAVTSEAEVRPQE